MKKLFFVFIFIFWLLINVAPVSAAEDEPSVISQDVTYNVSETGTTNVVMNTAITNKSSKTYTVSYTIELGFDDIKNVKASDKLGLITPEISKTDKGQKVSLDFNERVVGIDNILNFKLDFDTEKIARKQGNIWEVNIPGLVRQTDFSYFNVHVKVPKSFGNPSIIKPYKDNKNLDFSKEDLGNSGIFISFGENQIYGFNLTYHLQNANLFPIRTEIALPPDTNYQKVIIEIIDPDPLNVVKDRDGNWIAYYYLMPSEKKHINVKGKAKIFLTPEKQEESSTLISDYLKELPYWQVSNPKIQKLAKELKTPENIYNFVVKTLKYDFSRVTDNKPRAGAVETLNNPSSTVCMEFTDLFIAIARAAGIPAREVNGFAFAENSKERPVSLIKDVLHAWPEYYDYNQKTWIMVDPTWGNTTNGMDYFKTFDFDHFAFVIKGIESDYPVPAGGYKLTGSEVYKDVNVDFADNFKEDLPVVDIKTNLSNEFFSLFPVKGTISFYNKNKILFPKQLLTIKSNSLYPKERKVVLDEIPPYGYLQIPFYFEKMPMLTNKKAIIEFRVAGRSIFRKVNISPFFIKDWRIIGGVFFGIFSIGLLIIAQRTWGLPFFRQKQ